MWKSFHHVRKKFFYYFLKKLLTFSCGYGNIYMKLQPAAYQAVSLCGERWNARHLCGGYPASGNRSFPWRQRHGARHGKYMFKAKALRNVQCDKAKLLCEVVALNRRWRTEEPFIASCDGGASEGNITRAFVWLRRRNPCIRRKCRRK